VKEPSKNHDIWVRLSLGSCTFYFRVGVRFLVKPEFWFGSFLLGSVGWGSFPSLRTTTGSAGGGGGA